MAISWGSWAAGQSGSQSRLGVDRTVTSTASTTTVTLTIYLEFSGYVAQSSATLTLSGAHSASQGVSLSFSGSGTRNLGTFTNTFTRSYTTAQTKTTNVSVTGFAGGSPTLSTSSTVPRRAYAAPSAPTSVTVTRVNDSSADVSWSAPTSSSAPVEEVNIIRQVNDGGWVYGGAWVSQATGTLRVTGQARGNRYRWAVKSHNRDGESAWTYSPWLYQRPLDVGNVTAARSGTDIVVSWVDRNAYQYGGARIYDNGVEVATVPAGTTTWTHTAPSTATTHTYRVEAYYGALTAAPVSSNTVQLLAAPLAPTNLSPNGGYVAATTSQRLEWSHNSADGTPQKNYELRVRRVGTTTWTTYSSTTLEYRNITVSTFAADGQAIEWQVRTRGEHPDWSPWSQVASFAVASRPTVTISTPTAGQVVDAATTPVTFTISRVPATWTVEVRDSSNATVWTRTDYTLTSPVTVTAGALRNGETYTTRVWATEKVDSTVQTRAISVSYAQPDPPTLEGEWDTTIGATRITVIPPAGSTPAPDTITVYRADGRLIGTLTGTLQTTILTDEEAPIHEEAAYYATSTATVAGQTVDSAPSPTLNLGRIPELANYLTVGSLTVRLRHMPDLARVDTTSDLQLIDLDDGTPDPVAIFGPKQRATTNLAGLLLDTPAQSAQEQADQFRQLALTPDLVLLRTIDAPPVWGVVTSPQLRRERWGGYTVTLTHTKAR